MDEISLWLYGVKASHSPKPNTRIVCPERGGTLTWVPVVLCVVRESCCLKGALRMPGDHSPFHSCWSVSWPWAGFFLDLGGIWVVNGLGLDDKWLSWKDIRPNAGKTKKGAKSHCSIETSWLLPPGWRAPAGRIHPGSLLWALSCLLLSCLLFTSGCSSFPSFVLPCLWEEQQLSYTHFCFPIAHPLLTLLKHPWVRWGAWALDWWSGHVKGLGDKEGQLPISVLWGFSP